MRLVATVSTWPQEETSLKSALKDFIYTEVWIQHRQANREWSQLVTYIGAFTAVNHKSENS